MACFGFVTFFPLRPDFSLPCFIARISRSTFLPAEGEYLRAEDFFDRDLLELDFFDAEPRVLFFALLLREERLEVLDFFLVAFFVAMTILLGCLMAGGLGQVACGCVRKVSSLSCIGVSVFTRCDESQEYAQADRQ